MRGGVRAGDVVRFNWQKRGLGGAGARAEVAGGGGGYLRRVVWGVYVGLEAVRGDGLTVCHVVD